MMRLPLGDLYDMDVSEFFSAYDGWLKLEHIHEQANLERTRWLGAVMLTPYSERAISPQELMPLPSDTKSVSDALTEDDFEARREAALKLYNSITHNE